MPARRRRPGRAQRPLSTGFLPGIAPNRPTAITHTHDTAPPTEMMPPAGGRTDRHRSPARASQLIRKAKIEENRSIAICKKCGVRKRRWPHSCPSCRTGSAQADMAVAGPTQPWPQRSDGPSGASCGRSPTGPDPAGTIPSHCRGRTLPLRPGPHPAPRQAADRAADTAPACQTAMPPLVPRP